MKEMSPKFSHKEVETGRYDKWIKDNIFKADPLKEGTPFSIILPPPNVTGKLHLGHAWDTSIQDLLIRYKRMNGFNALYLPGMDHAGIATQSKVEALLKEEGTDKHSIGREEFINRTWQWKEEYGGFIKQQFNKLGISLDYSKEKFTLDTDVNEIVSKVFIDLYNKGYIYQDYKITSWDPVLNTALSNIEVESKEIQGKEFYFKYVSVDNPNDYLEVMTTRPETMFGDVALCVNPDDDRYKYLVGKEYIVPNTDIKIPVILDQYADIDKGTGIVKISMAHDANDFEVGKRNNLEPRIVMNLDATMLDCDFVPSEFIGLDRFDARVKQVELAKQNNLFIKEEDITHEVGHSERSGAIIEPLLSKQWYVKMDELSKRAIDNQSSKDQVNFIPDRFNNTYLRWMEEVHDWCISRQLWWGHRIPAWYKEEEVKVQVKCPGDGWIQDEDVLDTWFSSALWPMVMTDYFKEDSSLKEKFYPTSTLVTGYDIIFFWVSRMIFQGLEFTDKAPFNDVFIHGLIRDKDGKKMSKSLGNGVDPMDIIDKYGADSLRYYLTTNSTPGQDMRFEEEKIESTWNFINKIWNISRYVLNNDIEYNDDVLAYQDKFNTSDIYILSNLNKTINNVNYNMDKYEFGEASRSLYNFIWEDYANWYLETSKVSIQNDIEKEKTVSILNFVLKCIIKMMHPYMPFVTESIYESIEQVDSIVNTSWPTPISFKESNNFEDIKDIIVAIRNIKQENDIKSSQEVSIIIDSPNKYQDYDELVIKQLAKVTNITYSNNEINEDVFSKVLSNSTVHMLSEGLIDKDAKIGELNTSLKSINQEIKRSIGMLSNEKFISNAPVDKLQEEKEKALNYIDQYLQVINLLSTYDIKQEVSPDIEKLKNLC
ncbi:MAG: valine--tRNA ligase [Mycoplasmatales bacterium]